MPLLIIVLGIAITLVALISTFLTEKKIGRSIDEFEKHEVELRTLKGEIDTAFREFKNLSQEGLNELEGKVRDINRAGSLVETKIKEGRSIVKILENTIEKTSNIEIGQRETPKKPEFDKSKILGLYKNGMSIRDISNKFGLSLEELKNILGL